MDANISYFDVLFVKCGVIGWVLWGLSVLTGAVIIRYFATIRRVRLIPPDLADRARALLARRQFHDVAAMTEEQDSFLAGLLRAAVAQSAQGYAAMERAMEEAAQVQSATLLRRVEWLNLIGNVSPMLGLLGTVWGMILAFFTIVATGGMPHPADLAGAIGTALVTTLVGLMIAIPALSVYATMRHRVDALTAEAMVLCQEWIAASQATRAAVIPMPPEQKKPARAALNPTAS
jgi:biopolymer transport protein ExbB